MPVKLKSAGFWRNISYILETVWENNELEIVRKFTYVRKFCENFKEMLGKILNARFWGHFFYISEITWGKDYVTGNFK